MRCPFVRCLLFVPVYFTAVLFSSYLGATTPSAATDPMPYLHETTTFRALLSSRGLSFQTRTLETSFRTRKNPDWTMEWVGEPRESRTDCADQLTDAAVTEHTAAFALRCREVFAGIDLAYRGDAETLEYDFHVRPHGDPGKIKFRLKGVSHSWLNKDGDLMIESPQAISWQRKPFTYQWINGRQVEIYSRFVILGEQEYGFEVADYDRSQELIIDPVIESSTAFMGSAQTTAHGVHADSSGFLYLFGSTSPSATLPNASPHLLYNWSSVFPGYKHFVSQLHPSLTSINHTSTVQLPLSMDGVLTAVDSQGHAFIAISSYTLPSQFEGDVTRLGSGFEGTSSRHRILIVGLNAQGNGIRVLSLLGCDGSLRPRSLTVDTAGRIYISGQGSCATTPDGAFRNAEATDTSNVFAARISPDGQTLERFAIIGGSKTETGGYLSLDAQGRPILTGSTESSDFPVSAGAYSSVFREPSDGFIVRLSPEMDRVEQATLIGGPGNDSVVGVIGLEGGGLLFSATTGSYSFPTTTGAYRPTGEGSISEGVIGRLSAGLDQLQMATYVGRRASGALIGVDQQGNLLYTSRCPNCSDSVTEFPLYTSLGINELVPVLLQVFSADGRRLSYGTFLPGEPTTVGYMRLQGGVDRVVVAALHEPGITSSTATPLTLPILGDTATTAKGLWLARINLASPLQCTIGLEPDQQSVPKHAAEYSIAVKAPEGCPWFATSERSDLVWTSLRTGLGNGVFSFSLPANRSYNYASHTNLRVNSVPAWVSQAPAGCDAILTPLSIAFGPDGGLRTATYDTAFGCGWGWTSGASWLQTTLPKTDGAQVGWDAKTFTLTAGPNHFAARSTVLKAGAEQMRIEQTAGSCTASVTPASASIGAAGGSLDFQLTTSAPNCIWQAGIVHGIGSKELAGLTTSAQGQGSTKATVAITPTKVNTPAVHQFEIAGIKVPITQAAGDCRVTFQQTTTSVPASGGEVRFSINTEGPACQWNQNTEASWITIVNQRDSFGSGSLHLVVKPNETGPDREATISILGHTLRVHQQGQSNVLVKIGATRRQIPVTVNGVVYDLSDTGVVTLSLPRGATVSLSVPTLYEEGPDTQWRFLGWNNSVSPNWVTTVPTDVESVSFNATFRDYHRVNLRSSSMGWVEASPSSPDGFYARFTQIQLTPRPVDGHHFVRWAIASIPSAGAQVPLAVSVLNPHSAGAIFAPNATSPAPTVQVRFAPDKLFYIQGSKRVPHRVQFTTAEGTAAFGLSRVECQSGAPLIGVTVSSFATPADIDLFVRPEYADGRAPGSYSCDVVVPRTDNGSPAEIRMPVTVEIRAPGTELGPKMAAVVSGASFLNASIVDSGIGTIFGNNLSAGIEYADALPLPGKLSGTSLYVAFGDDYDSRVSLYLFYVSPTQINFYAPAAWVRDELHHKPARIELYWHGALAHTIPISIAKGAPAVFTANSDGKGAPAGVWSREEVNGSQVTGDLFDCSAGAGRCTAKQIDWGDGSRPVYLTLYLTGLTREIQDSTTVHIGGVSATVTYAGMQPQYWGLQQVNVQVPISLLGTGEQDVVIRAGDLTANIVRVSF